MKLTGAETRIARARTHLLLGKPWFGQLALRLRVERDDSIESMANDGTRLAYNEAYVLGRTDKEMIALMAHEVMHCALGHMFRGGSRNWRKWNEACDIVINSTLRAEGFQIPETFLAPEEQLFIGMSSEQVYAARDKAPPSSSGGAGQPQPQGANVSPTPGQPGNKSEHGDGECACGLQPAPGEATNPAAEGEDRMTEVDWQVATEQATAAARKSGKAPGGIDRMVEANRKVRTDWRTLLRRFIQNTTPSDYSWSQPNRRYISQGMYLPGVVKENLPRIGVAVDTSGSIDATMLGLFAAELTAILHEARPESIDVVYCDTRVTAQESFSPDDPEVVLQAKGGGGTRFQPALDVFNENPPVCVIYLTDLYGPAPQEPDYPVLWATPEDNREEAPFGELVRLSKYE